MKNKNRMFNVVEAIVFAIWFMCLACLSNILFTYDLRVIEYICAGILLFINTYALTYPIVEWIKAHKRSKGKK